ncbi:MAG TPA: site-specific integrase, partial [Desulfomonilaceae bacterium]|nr:site-specific integrase [Desulfomonilaceae bacterium]
MWSRPIGITACYMGIRRGELLGLTAKRVGLSGRIIRLERKTRKKVPILKQVRKVTCLQTDKVFILSDEKGPAR